MKKLSKKQRCKFYTDALKGCPAPNSLHADGPEWFFLDELYMYIYTKHIKGRPIVQEVSLVIPWDTDVSTKVEKEILLMLCIESTK